MTYTQPQGTKMSEGNMITKTRPQRGLGAMLALVLGVLGALMSAPASAQQYGLYPTGVDDDGVGLVVGSTDTHYEVDVTVGGTGGWTSPVIARGNFCGSCGGLWFLHPGPVDEPPVGSAPLSHPNFQQTSGGTGRVFLFRTSFTIPSDGSVDPTKLRLRYRIGFDDYSRNAVESGNLPATQHAVWVNGVAQTITHEGACSILETNCQSTIPAGSFVAGVNTLEWRIRNDTTYYGFRVRDVVFQTVCTVVSECNDGDPCTTDACTSGVCAYGDAAEGTVCDGGYCDGVRNCVECTEDSHCDDSNDCTTESCSANACIGDFVEAPNACAGGVCDGAGLCEVCIDDGVAVDAGCTAGQPHCIGASGARSCVRCTEGSHCDDGNECTADVCSDTNTCSNDTLPLATTCTGGFCSTLGVCSPCVDDSILGTDSGCVSDEPYCSPLDASCGSCEDSTSGDVDRGCLLAAPNCVVTGLGRQCTACIGDADCDDANECTAELCMEGLCLTTPVLVGAACSGGVCDVNTVCAPLAVDIVTPADGELLTTVRPTFAGTATPGVTVDVAVDGTPIGSVVADATGAWQLPAPSDLPEGPHMVVATVTVSGDTADDAEDFLIDVSTFVEIVAVENNQTIVGTGEPGASVTVTIDGVDYGPAVVSEGGSWTLTLPTPLPEGTHTIDARIRDRADNMATDTFDHTVPAAMTDAGVPDAEVDAATPADAATVADAAIAADAAPESRYSGGGLSCSASSRTNKEGLFWGVLALAMGLVIRRRRQHR